jgi:multiple sugar transport system substrate-binding protein
MESLDFRGSNRATGSTSFTTTHQPIIKGKGMKTFKTIAAIAVAAALPLSVAVAPANAASTTITYGLWDSNQLPGYQQCANDFHKANPNITVKITQAGWDDYWKKVNAGFLSGQGFDVFTSHLAFFPDFVANKQILPLDSYIKKDKVAVNTMYQPGLASLWKAPDGHQYGLPKDFDTIAVFVNKKMTDAAGISQKTLENLTWNPTDGGTYEKTIAHLTIDKNGVRGDEKGFDKNNVATYGIWMEGSGGGDGQTQWSFLAATNGWKVNDGPWNTNYHYDSPKLAETIKWWAGLVDKGYMPSFAKQNGVGWSDQLSAGKVAMASNGSWMTGSVFGAKNANFDPEVVPTPVGPNGKRASMYNGLADNISAKTKHPAEAWQWVKYLGSAKCEDVIASKAVVFPAIPEATAKAVKAFTAKGIDVNAFYTHITNKDTFLFPIANKKSQINTIITPVMDAIMSGTKDVSALKGANDQIKALFK